MRLIKKTIVLFASLRQIINFQRKSRDLITLVGEANLFSGITFSFSSHTPISVRITTSITFITFRHIDQIKEVRSLDIMLLFCLNYLPVPTITRADSTKDSMVFKFLNIPFYCFFINLTFRCNVGYCNPVVLFYHLNNSVESIYRDIYIRDNFVFLRA